MKEYKLKAWPDLPAAFRQTSYRRLLSELSQRHIHEADLQSRSGLSRRQLHKLMALLATQQVLEVREAKPKPARWQDALPWLMGFWRRFSRA